jgi:hypothetical protein
MRHRKRSEVGKTERMIDVRFAPEATELTSPRMGQADMQRKGRGNFDTIPQMRDQIAPNATVVLGTSELSSLIQSRPVLQHYLALACSQEAEDAFVAKLRHGSCHGFSRQPKIICYVTTVHRKIYDSWLPQTSIHF